ncbi:13574_t:CDS:2 [Dentiscutata heterogama]|uniref:13574_t:CDS:1 n=1 Tax=Dentiscutata heterogama TaxID=1316150 RepID=A0ACA9LYI5_9GLOM|nr:13574_t:CDS:2 [Dentiscutata heterogama]
MSKVLIQSSFKPEEYNFRSFKKHESNDESKEEIPEVVCEIICFLGKQFNYSTRKIGKLIGAGRLRLLLPDDEKEVIDILSSKKGISANESKFIHFGYNHRQFYWKHLGDPFQDEYVRGTKPFGGGGVMIWGCITSKGVSHLCCIENSIDSEAYHIILAKKLFGTLLQYDLSVNDIIFQQNQAPAHKSGDTKNWLHYRNLEFLDWPPYSPDLNTIEDLWV